MAKADYPYSAGKRVQPSVAAPPAEGRNRPKRSRKRGKKKKTVVDAEGWCHPAKTAPPPVVEARPGLALSNTYHPLIPTSVEEPVVEESGSSSSSRRTRRQTPRPSTAPPKASPSKKAALVAKQAQPPPPEIKSRSSDFQAQQVYDRPYRASYFIPGKVEGRSAQFLLDTGCTTNLLAKHVFD